MTSRFATDTAVVPIGPGRYRGTIDPGWWIIRGPNGGYLAAIVTRAVRCEVEGTGQRMRSLTLHYLRAPVEGPCEVEVAVERRGRTLTSLSIRVSQDERLCMLGLAATAVDRDGPSFGDLPLPKAAPPIEAVETSAPADGPPIPMRERYELQPRLGPDRMAGETGDEAITGGWIRLADPEPLGDAVVAALTDAWSPAIFSRVAEPLGVPTIDLTIHFRDPAPADYEWCFVEFRSRHATGGYVEEDGVVWSRDGRLLAQSRQLAVELPLA